LRVESCDDMHESSVLTKNGTAAGMVIVVIIVIYTHELMYI
jgi:hypothetical protein